MSSALTSRQEEKGNLILLVSCSVQVWLESHRVRLFTGSEAWSGPQQLKASARTGLNMSPRSRLCCSSVLVLLQYSYPSFVNEQWGQRNIVLQRADVLQASCEDFLLLANWFQRKVAEVPSQLQSVSQWRTWYRIISRVIMCAYFFLSLFHDDFSTRAKLLR